MNPFWTISNHQFNSLKTMISVSECCSEPINSLYHSVWTHYGPISNSPSASLMNMNFDYHFTINHHLLINRLLSPLIKINHHISLLLTTICWLYHHINHHFTINHHISLLTTIYSPIAHQTAWWRGSAKSVRPRWSTSHRPCPRTAAATRGYASTCAGSCARRITVFDGFWWIIHAF